MGRTACTEPQCLYSRATPLLPLWAVRSVQSLSACTVELYLYSPYGPYGLYNGALYLTLSFFAVSTHYSCHILSTLQFPWLIFFKTLKYQITQKPVQVGNKLLHADERT
jgi:hypothetical protein